MVLFISVTDVISIPNCNDTICKSVKQSDAVSSDSDDDDIELDDVNDSSKTTEKYFLKTRSTSSIIVEY